MIPMGGGWNTTHLAVGPDCLYFNDGHEFAGLEWQGESGASVLSTISGPHSELYQREACPQGDHLQSVNLNKSV